MKTSKELAIEKAWVELVGFVPEHSENGYHDIVFENEKIYNFDSISVGHGMYKIRPKSLAGIENNAGWTRINEDGSNLPPIDRKTYYETCQFINGTTYYWGDYNGHELPHYFENGKVTHFRNIIEHQPPLY